MMPIVRMPTGEMVNMPDNPTAKQLAELELLHSPSGLKPLTRMEKFGKGLRDPIEGGAQLLTNILPEPVVKAGNRLNNWLADNTGMVARLPEGGVDQQVREAEQQYQARRSAGGESGLDAYRMAGNVVNPANIALASKLPAAATTLGRIGVGAGYGGASSLLTPVSEGDFGKEKAKQAAVGAFFGGATPVVTGGLSRFISPNASRNPNVELLRQEGVRPTIGQTLGGRWNAAEEKLTSIPIMGDAIAAARGRALQDFNRATINRATAPIGQRVDDIGHTGVTKAGDALSDAFESTLNKSKGVRLDGQFANEVNQLHDMTRNMLPDMQSKFDKTYRDVLIGRLSKNGSMLPEVYKKVDSELGVVASRYGKSSVASEQELGDAITQLKNLLQQQAMRSNPQMAKELAAAKEGWANLVRVEGAAKAAKNSEGIFTPGQLNQAIQTADNSVRGRAVSRGTSMMQDLGNAGQQVVGNKVPNSFTTDRALMAGGALGSYFVNPLIPSGLAGGALLYSPAGQRMLTTLAATRPQGAKAAADAVEKHMAALLPLSTQLGLGLFNQ